MMGSVSGGCTRSSRRDHIEMIKAAKDADPSELIGLYGRSFVFHGHPYGRAVIGSESSLAAISHRDILDYYAANFGADRLTLDVGTKAVSSDQPTGRRVRRRNA